MHGPSKEPLSSLEFSQQYQTHPNIVRQLSWCSHLEEEDWLAILLEDIETSDQKQFQTGHQSENCTSPLLSGTATRIQNFPKPDDSGIISREPSFPNRNAFCSVEII